MFNNILHSCFLNGFDCCILNEIFGTVESLYFTDTDIVEARVLTEHSVYTTAIPEQLTGGGDATTQQQSPASGSKHRHHHKHHHHHHKRHRQSKEVSSEASVNTVSTTPIGGSLAPPPNHHHPVLDLKAEVNADHGRLLSSPKKRIVSNCGVQVNLRRRTESKSVQVSDTGQGPPIQFLPPPSPKKPPRVSRGCQTNDTVSSQYNPCDSILKAVHPYPVVVPQVKAVHSSVVVPQVKAVHPVVLPQVKAAHPVIVPQVEHKIIKPPSVSRSLSTRPLPTPLSTMPTNSAELETLLQSCKYKHLLHMEQHANGGAVVAHVYQHEISHLSAEAMAVFVGEYFDVVYGEDSGGTAFCVMGIVHQGGADMPDFMDYFSDKYPNMVVKAGILGKPEIETLTMAAYRDRVAQTYVNGTFRTGPLLQVSVCFIIL
jgi:hypothetical protein